MKKLMLFASLAMAVVAFAVPSTASAIWTHKHVHIPLNTNPQIHGEGNAHFGSGIGGIACTQVTATAQLTGGTTTAHVQQFNPTLGTCKPTGGLTGCTITSITPEGFPWTGHIVNTVVTMTGVTIKNKLSGFLCPPELQLITNQPHHALLQPEDEFQGTGGHTLITGLDIGGSLTIAGQETTANATGTITPTDTSNRTYGYT